MTLRRPRPTPQARAGLPAAPRSRSRRSAAVVAGAALAASLTVAAPASQAAPSAVEPLEPPLSTPWTDEVSADNALPEYPRPALAREQWQNLNGEWQFEEIGEDETPTPGAALDDRIIVPYPVESALSGVQDEEVDSMVYRRTFTVPRDWRVGTRQDLRLNFGAVDWAATVWVNGQQVAEHTGGYDAFSVDVTDALRPGRGPQELIVKAVDPTDAAGIPVGKQREDPGGIFYTASSGIWQTVWMEPVPSTSAVTELDVTPDLDASAFRMTVGAEGASRLATVEAVVTGEDGEEVARASGTPGAELVLPVEDPRLWSPDDPFLYDMTVTLRDGRGVDTVTSYAGMRSIEVGEVDGDQRFLLNGEPVFLQSTLDQGYWPDGIYTAPTDEALRFDIEQTKKYGFNTIRKHIKVEPARWYYWADRLGMMVWQDMPSTRIDDSLPESDHEKFEDELHRMVDQHDSVTSIIGWIPFNEGWGEWSREATARIAGDVAEQDPSRVVNAASGVNCCLSKGDSGAGDVIDWHQYQGPAFPTPDGERAPIDGEHGGLTLPVEGHTWPGGSLNPYGAVADEAALNAAYVDNQEKVAQGARGTLAGSIYTQITDVETELNGLWTYDRQVEKVDPAQLRAVHERIYRAADNREALPPALQGTGYWPMDEGSGDVAADAVDGADLDFPAGVSWTDGRPGSAVEVDGSQWGETDEPVVDTDYGYSVSAWVRMDSKDGFKTAVSQDGTSASAFFLQYSNEDDAFAFSFVGRRAVAADVGSPELGRWYHLTGVRDVYAGQLRIYVDGQLAGETAAGAGDRTAGPTVVGRGLFDGNPVDFWDGALDEVHVYDHVLAPSEIQRIATAEQPQG
ncbi:LamG-like jellyroll fold domain-containing protein [Pseudokineococcus basanitobsidens]|uniref:LamG-like jellyroll fold domain-containing protein n=1 Tax=Pseudokineococcus basanitobsidens TaxID=1926649 RepID=A0ABU8RH89_9ACTN